MQESTSYTAIEKKIRIGFFGTPYLASCVLHDLFCDPDFEVVFIVTNPDKPIGRSGELQPTPVKKLALEKDIPIYTPTKIRDNRELFEQLWNHNCDYFIVVAYGRFLPIEILQMPKKLSINVHGSLLPKYRGASPIQAALLHGEKETGVTIMVMSEGMDEGDMLAFQKINISPTETSETLFQKFASVSGQTLISTIINYEFGLLTKTDMFDPIPQDHTLATYCKKIEKEDGLIDWSKSSEDIYHMWQAYTPWPGIYTMYEGKRLLIEKVSFYAHPDGGLLFSLDERREFREGTLTPISELHENDEADIGKVVKLDDGTIGITCGRWILTLEQVKLEWKKSQSIKDFVNGNQKFIWYTF